RRPSDRARHRAQARARKAKDPPRQLLGRPRAPRPLEARRPRHRPEPAGRSAKAARLPGNARRWPPLKLPPERPIPREPAMSKLRTRLEHYVVRTTGDVVDHLPAERRPELG